MMRALVLAALLALPLPAAAEDCAGADGVIEEIECLADVLAAEDAKLNAIWPRVLTEHPSGDDFDAHTAEIRASQRAWIAFRDADCEARSKTGIPKYWEVNRMSCLIEHTRARTATLTEVYLY